MLGMLGTFHFSSPLMQKLSQALVVTSRAKKLKPNTLGPDGPNDRRLLNRELLLSNKELQVIDLVCARRRVALDQAASYGNIEHGPLSTDTPS